MPRARTYYTPFNLLAGATVTGGDSVLPVLSSAQNGTETSDGTTNFGATTTKSNGGFYWAVTADAGTATADEVVNGYGAAIIEGKAGRVAVTAAGAVTAAAVTGLSASTAYELFFVHVDANGNRSAAATVGFTTTV